MIHELLNLFRKKIETPLEVITQREKVFLILSDMRDSLKKLRKGNRDSLERINFLKCTNMAGMVKEHWSVQTNLGFREVVIWKSWSPNYVGIMNFTFYVEGSAPLYAIVASEYREIALSPYLYDGQYITEEQIYNSLMEVYEIINFNVNKLNNLERQHKESIERFVNRF